MLYFSKVAVKSLILEKSGVGDVLRCELAEEGQDVFAEEYPDEYVQLAVVAHEFALCQLEVDRRCSLYTDLGDPRSGLSMVVKFSQTRVGYDFSGVECRSTDTVSCLEARNSSASLG